MCKDITGNLLKAEFVIQHCIVCLKKHLVQKVGGMFKGAINSGDIEYVLTVPAIWEDNAILFMRSAAVNVSIWERVFELTFRAQNILYNEILQLDIMNSPQDHKHNNSIISLWKAQNAHSRFEIRDSKYEVWYLKFKI